jgi:cell division protein FtsL
MTSYALPRPRPASQGGYLVQRRTGTRPATPAANFRMRRLAVLFGLLVVAALIAAVLFHLALAQNQVELDRLERRVEAKQREYEQRMNEVSTLSSPERIRTRATELGFVEPDPEHVTYVPAPEPEAAAPPEAPPNSLASWEAVKGHIAGAP